jgi:ArsR family transcriptional regulator
MRGRKDREIYYAHAEFCKMFSHPVRLAILDSLRAGEKTVTQLKNELGVRQSVVSQQLSLLRRLGVVRTRRTGRLVHYQLTDKRIIKAYDLINQVIREARMIQLKIVR